MLFFYYDFFLSWIIEKQINKSCFAGCAITLSEMCVWIFGWTSSGLGKIWNIHTYINIETGVSKNQEARRKHSPQKHKNKTLMTLINFY